MTLFELLLREVVTVMPLPVDRASVQGLLK